MAYKIDQAVGYNLKKQRLAQGLTQDALGKLAGMTKQGISNIESGKGAASKTITTIADCLHISPFDLYKEIEPEANINFKRVTSPDRIYFNRQQYNKEISAMINNIISDTKDEIYYKAVVPVVKESLVQNRDMLLQRLEIRCNVVNYNILEVYFEELLSSIRTSIYKKDDNVEELTEKIKIKSLKPYVIGNDGTYEHEYKPQKKEPATDNKRPYNATDMDEETTKWLDRLNKPDTQHRYNPNDNENQ